MRTLAETHESLTRTERRYLLALWYGAMKCLPASALGLVRKGLAERRGSAYHLTPEGSALSRRMFGQ